MCIYIHVYIYIYIYVYTYIPISAQRAAEVYAETRALRRQLFFDTCLGRMM